MFDLIGVQLENLSGEARSRPSHGWLDRIKITLKKRKALLSIVQLCVDLVANMKFPADLNDVRLKFHGAIAHVHCTSASTSIVYFCIYSGYSLHICLRWGIQFGLGSINNGWVFRFICKSFIHYSPLLW